MAPTHRACQAADPRVGCRVRPAGSGGASGASPGGPPRHLPDLQRGVRRHRRYRRPTTRPVGRRDPAGADGAPTAAGGDRGGLPARADAAPRCAASRPDRRLWSARPAARRAGPQRRWDAKHGSRRAEERCSTAVSAGDGWGSTRSRPRSPPSTTGRPRPRRPTGPRSSPCTDSSTPWPTTRWSPSTAPWPWPWSTVPRQDWPSSTRWPRACRTTRGSPSYAVIWPTWPATTPRRARSSVRRPSAPRTGPSATICSPWPRGPRTRPVRATAGRVLKPRQVPRAWKAWNTMYAGQKNPSKIA